MPNQHAYRPPTLTLSSLSTGVPEGQCPRLSFGSMIDCQAGGPHGQRQQRHNVPSGCACQPDQGSGLRQQQHEWVVMYGMPVVKSL